MNTTEKHNHLSDAASLARIRRLIDELEQALAQAPADTPHLQELKTEVDHVKATLTGADKTPDDLAENLQAVRQRMLRVADNVENEVLRDTPYLAELGRILGLV